MNTQYHSWQFLLSNDPESSLNPQKRLRYLLLFFAFCFAIVVLRTTVLLINDAAAYRIEASRPIESLESIAGQRGRILTRQGDILAEDRKIAVIAVKYRWLQNPPNQKWFTHLATKNLSGSERRDQLVVNAEIEKLKQQRQKLHQDLIRLGGLSQETWNARTAKIQSKVSRIHEHVNRYRFRKIAKDRQQAYQNELDESKNQTTPQHIGKLILQSLFTPDPPLRVKMITIREELDYHTIAEHINDQAIDEINNHPDQYPGVKVQYISRRTYPLGPVAAHLVGYLGSPTAKELKSQPTESKYHPEDRIGRMGLERQFQSHLLGRRGVVLKKMNRRGRLITTSQLQSSEVGQDVVISLDLRLQKFAENLLDSAQLRKTATSDQQPTGGGALLLLNLHNGEVITAATSPRFDPRVIQRGDVREIRQLLGGVNQPMLDRTSQMAIPPGSVFKLLTSVALLDTSTIDPDDEFFCRGYLNQPESWRCMVYRQTGIGHADLNLATALAKSCNVYFFHHTAKMGPEPLVGWAKIFGFGQKTGSDWSFEVAGGLPTPQKIKKKQGRKWQTSDTMALAIGQSSLTVTPLQIAVMTSIIANGGKKIRPHLVISDNAPITSNKKIAGLDSIKLQAIRQGMIQSVNHPGGTLYRSLRLQSVKIAAKTGTAQTGSRKADHAWITGFVPADKPQYVFVIALQHAGNASTAAGPVAQRFIRRMNQLGYFKKSKVADKNTNEK